MSYRRLRAARPGATVTQPVSDLRGGLEGPIPQSGLDSRVPSAPGLSGAQSPEWAWRSRSGFLPGLRAAPCCRERAVLARREDVCARALGFLSSAWILRPGTLLQPHCSGRAHRIAARLVLLSFQCVAGCDLRRDESSGCEGARTPHPVRVVDVTAASDLEAGVWPLLSFQLSLSQPCAIHSRRIAEVELVRNPEAGAPHHVEAALRSPGPYSGPSMKHSKRRTSVGKMSELKRVLLPGGQPLGPRPVLNVWSRSGGTVMFCLEVVFLFCASVLSVVKRLCFANLSKQLNVGRKPAYWEEIFERILFIWAIRHPASGYVQGINDLVTPFFVVFICEYLGGVQESDWGFRALLSPERLAFQCRLHRQAEVYEVGQKAQERHAIDMFMSELRDPSQEVLGQCDESGGSFHRVSPSEVSGSSGPRTYCSPGSGGEQEAGARGWTWVPVELGAVLVGHVVPSLAGGLGEATAMRGLPWRRAPSGRRSRNKGLSPYRQGTDGKESFRPTASSAAAVPSSTWHGLLGAGDTESQGAAALLSSSYCSGGTEHTDGEDVAAADVSHVPADVLRNVEADTYWCMSKLLDGIQDNYTFAQPGIQMKVKMLEELVSRIDDQCRGFHVCTLGRVLFALKVHLRLYRLSGTVTRSLVPGGPCALCGATGAGWLSALCFAFAVLCRSLCVLMVFTTEIKTGVRPFSWGPPGPGGSSSRSQGHTAARGCAWPETGHQSRVTSSTGPKEPGSPESPASGRQASGSLHRERVRPPKGTSAPAQPRGETLRTEK
ncbi:hypothetical protein CB1_000279031 [Camelus ferus]|nr:hypothetical protein CB1_000279031 [Camelus ferus]